MPLMIESDEKGGVKVIAEQLLPFLKRFDQLGIDTFAAFAE